MIVLVGFELLIINYTQLIPPNLEQKLQIIDNWLCHWCWRMTRLNPRSSMVYPVFNPSHDTIWKPFLFWCWSSCSHVTVYHLTSLSFNLYGTRCPGFCIILNAFKYFETVVWSIPNDSASSAWTWHEVSWSNAFNFSNFFVLPERSLSSTSKSLFLKCLNQSCCF